jgi:SAM-dependent methyltransferase
MKAPGAEGSVDVLLAQVQSDILNSDPGDGYRREYRVNERHYWEHVPGWISEFPRSIRVVDIGCAYATLAVFTRRLLDAEVVCVDIIPKHPPRTLLRSEGIPFVVRDVERELIDDLGRFDLVLFTEVLEHLNFHPRTTLAKLKGLLRPAGKLILSTPDAAEWGRVTQYYSEFDEMTDPVPSRPWIDAHIWQYTEDELKKVLADSGFKIDRFEWSAGIWGRHFNLLCSSE